MRRITQSAMWQITKFPKQIKKQSEQENCKCKRMLKNLSAKTIAFGIDECAALVIDGDEYRIIKSKTDAKVFKCYHLNREYKSVEIDDFGKIEDLYQK